MCFSRCSRRGERVAEKGPSRRRPLLADQLFYFRHVGVGAGGVAGGAAGRTAVDVCVDVGGVQTDGIVEIGEGVNVALLAEIGIAARVVSERERRIQLQCGAEFFDGLREVFLLKSYMDRSQE